MAFLWIRESQKKEKETGVSSRVLCENCTDQDKKDRGCKGGHDWPIGKYTYDRCPENLMTEEVMMYFDIWTDWKLFKPDGFPFPGNRLSQPMWVIDSIRILEEAVSYGS